VEEEQLTNGVGMFQYNGEVAGQIMLSVTAYDQKDLNQVLTGIEKAFVNFEENGIPEEDLKRIKAGQETNFYDGLSSVLGKGFQLAQYEIFAGDPGYINEDVQRILDVSAEDVMRVYNTYIKDKKYVATSFVPKDRTELVLANSVLADVVEEKIVEGAEESFGPNQIATYEKTPSGFDRSQEPPYGESPDVSIPEIWKKDTETGMKVFGIENYEVPLVQFEIRLNGGMLLEDTSKIGVSNMIADLMTKGTATKTPEELETLIESLGARISMSASKQYLTIRGNTLAKNFDKVMAIVTEILLEPRWDQKEFDLIKQSTLSTIQRQKANPNSIASNEFAKVMYGDEHVLANNNRGTTTSVNAINLEDLKNYYINNLSPNLTVVKVVGAVSMDNTLKALQRLIDDWEVKDIEIPEIPEAVMPDKSTVYFYDVPGAKQSVLYFGYPSLKITDEDYYATTLVNYRLGGGGFASQLTQELREGKGYTYGIRSGFSANTRTGSFLITSGVRSNVTYEATDLVRNILKNYGTNFNENDLEITKGFTLKSGARAFESLRAKLGMLSNISDNGFSEDYVKEREAIVKGLTIEEVKELASVYIRPDKMIYLIVGDAATQLDKLENLGFGKPILLNATD
jgi:zinc protease